MHVIILLLTMLLSVQKVEPLLAQSEKKAAHSYRPENGYVPDEKTAVAIAEAVWLPIYGKKAIDSQRPFKAVLKDDVWTVTGTFNFKGNYKGGVALAEISKTDGRILRVSHGM